MSSALRSAQRWFAAVVTGDGPLPRSRRVAVAGALDARSRLGIYRFAHGERLRGVMANDYPALQHAVGEKAFARLVAAYARVHPSRHPNLNRLGAKFPAFLARRLRTLRISAFVVDLAVFEWAITTAGDTERRPPLDLESLRAIDAARWSSLRLRLQPSAHLLMARTDVAAWYDAWVRGVAPKRAASRRSFACVHRHGARIVRRDLDRRQFAVLRAIARGATLDAALRHAGPDAPVGEWFAEQARLGLFVAPPREGR